MHAFRAAALVAAAFASVAARAAHELEAVTVHGGRPSSLPSEIPATKEGITREQVEQGVNATDSEDALKYLPSLLVRKRFVGDYNHAVLSSRASGTGNSARSAVYADGMLLSNFLGNGVGGLSFPPRWGLVTPEEIERVDVMYGPFSAAYPGNSVGAVVEYRTRMPKAFEAHGALTATVQPFDLYGTHRTYRTWQASASVGTKVGDWSWWLNANRTDSDGQPLTYATRLVSAGGAATGVPVTGAVPDRSNANQPWLLLGSGSEYATRQDHLKAKVAYDISPSLRASYVAGLWRNDSAGKVASWLRNAQGQAVETGAIAFDGRGYTLTAADFAPTQEKLSHRMQGASLKRHTRGVFDWEVAASRYDYARDEKRQAGTVFDGAGTGWTTLALRGTWRPSGEQGAHVVELGAQQDSYALRYAASGAAPSNVRGDTQLRSLWAQDAWRFAPQWKSVLGLRAEQWSARDGLTQIGTVVNTPWPARRESHLSPKASVAWEARPDLTLKASLGRALRMPTVAELYGATSTVNAQFINDPALRPERSWTGELSAEKQYEHVLLRATLFAERTRDALYSQTAVDPAANRNVTRVQNVGRIDTKGLELAANADDLFHRGIDLNASLTYADSAIRENAGFVTTPGDTIGKRQPNVPRWRANALAIWRVTPVFSTSLGARYSGTQFRTLDNADVNGATYMGASRFFVVDLRARWQFAPGYSAAFGIDNVTDRKYWNFHPYPQRSFHAELKAHFR